MAEQRRSSSINLGPFVLYLDDDLSSKICLQNLVYTRQTEECGFVAVGHRIE
jgi:hypothetical protein